MDHKVKPLTLKLLLIHLSLAAALGTIALLALADNPWDGDELLKGPFAGISSYCGGDFNRIYALIRGIK